MRTLLSSMLLVSLVFCLSACGGGGGADPTPGGDPNERPRIASTTPLPGEDGVNAGDVIIEIHFEDPLEPGSVAADQVRVSTPAGEIAGSTYYVPGSRSMRFDPDEPLHYGAEHEVVLRAGLRDLEGNERSQDFTFRFTSAPGEFGGANPAEFTDDDARMSVMHMNKSGNGFLVYYRDEGGGFESLRVRRILPNGDMLGEREIAVARDISVHTQGGMAISESGSAVIAWKYETASGDTDAAMRFYDASTGTWLDVEPLEDDASYDARSARVVIDRDRHVVAAIHRRAAGFMDDFRVAQYSPSQGLSPIRTVSTVTTRGGTADLAGSESGHAAFVWAQDNASELYDTYAAMYDPTNGGWQATQKVENETLETLAPLVAMDNEGHALVGWERRSSSTPGVSTLWARRYSPDTGYSSPRQLDGEAEHTRPYATHVDASGRGLLVVAHDAVGDERISAYPWSRAGWGSRIDLSERDATGFRTSKVRIAAGADGRLAVAWTQDERPGVPGPWVAAATRSNDVWSPARYLAETHRSGTIGLGVAVPPNRGAMVVFTSDADDSALPYPDRVLARGVRLDGGLEEIQTLNAPGERAHRGLQFVMGPSGAGIAAWDQGQAGSPNRDVYLSRIQ